METGGAAVPYSLVSATTLGFDLVRLPAGRGVADALLAGLAADAAGLGGVAPGPPGPAFDLVRLPAGRGVADALLAGLAADAAGLERLASVHPAAGRDREERA